MPTTTSQRIHQRTVDRAGWTETFVTARVETPVETPAQASAVFEALAVTLAERGVRVLQEKVYGLTEHMDALLTAQRRAYATHGLDPVPATFIEGIPCIGGLLAGVQVIGAIPHSAGVVCRTVEHDHVAVGRLLETPSYRAIFLSGVSDPACASGTCVTDQSTRMFDRAGALLAQEDFAPSDIVRTWIYLARLLDWYGEFNRVRTACFKRWGLMTDSHTGVLPASTGIQGRRHPGEECFMDVFALSRGDGTRAGVEPMRNTRQNEAYEYGSSFSRGMAVGLDGAPALYISGTASINPRGKTVYHDDHQGQLVETLLDVHALLTTRNAAFKDICQATAYCKEERDWRTFKRFLEFMDWPDMPVIPVYADVCRDELLFEMDAIAVAG